MHCLCSSFCCCSHFEIQKYSYRHNLQELTNSIQNYKFFQQEISFVLQYYCKSKQQISVSLKVEGSISPNEIFLLSGHIMHMELTNTSMTVTLINRGLRQRWALVRNSFTFREQRDQLHHGVNKPDFLELLVCGVCFSPRVWMGFPHVLIQNILLQVILMSLGHPLLQYSSEGQVKCRGPISLHNCIMAN